MEPPEHRGQEVDSCLSNVNNYERGFSFYSQEDTSARPSAVDVPTEGVAGSEGKSSSLNPSKCILGASHFWGLGVHPELTCSSRWAAHALFTFILL